MLALLHSGAWKGIWEHPRDERASPPLILIHATATAQKPGFEQRGVRGYIAVREHAERNDIPRMHEKIFFLIPRRYKMVLRSVAISTSPRNASLCFWGDDLSM